MDLRRRVATETCFARKDKVPLDGCHGRIVEVIYVSARQVLHSFSVVRILRCRIFVIHSAPRINRISGIVEFV